MTSSSTDSTYPKETGNLTIEVTPQVVARFWSKVDKSGDCWLWTGSKNSEGYGVIKILKKMYKAHRVAFTVLTGPIPKDLMIDHMCHTRLCVNPEHLRLATCAQNNANRRGASSNSRSGIRGVRYHSGRWEASACMNGRTYYAGRFDSAEEANQAAIEIRKRIFK